MPNVNLSVNKANYVPSCCAKDSLESNILPQCNKNTHQPDGAKQHVQQVDGFHHKGVGKSGIGIHPETMMMQGEFESCYRVFPDENRRVFWIASYFFIFYFLIAYYFLARDA